MQQNWSYLTTTEVVKYYISMHLNIKEIFSHLFHISVEYTNYTALHKVNTQSTSDSFRQLQQSPKSVNRSKAQPVL